MSTPFLSHRAFGRAQLARDQVEVRRLARAGSAHVDRGQIVPGVKLPHVNRRPHGRRSGW
jgi:hypothetical protein